MQTTSLKMKDQIVVLILAVAVTTVSCFPSNPYGPPVKQHAIPYSFSYGITDEYAGTNFGQTEDSDGNTVKGSYTVDLSDGRKQIVKYVADHHNGYQAEVSYKGDAQYPPPPQYPPFVVKAHPQQYRQPEPLYGETRDYPVIVEAETPLEHHEDEQEQNQEQEQE